MDDQATTGTSGGVKYHELRIAWSVLWGVVAVLLCVLWVRSYWKMDTLHIPVHRSQIFFGSFRGYFQAHYDGFERDDRDWKLRSFKSTSYPDFHRGSDFGARGNPTFVHAMGPDWILLLVVATFTAIPWVGHLKWRFSLRTLLIATTLVAVVLGVVVWLARR